MDTDNLVALGSMRARKAAERGRAATPAALALADARRAHFVRLTLFAARALEEVGQYGAANPDIFPAHANAEAGAFLAAVAGHGPSLRDFAKALDEQSPEAARVLA